MAKRDLLDTADGKRAWDLFVFLDEEANAGNYVTAREMCNVLGLDYDHPSDYQSFSTAKRLMRDEILPTYERDLPHPGHDGTTWRYRLERTVQADGLAWKGEITFVRTLYKALRRVHRRFVKWADHIDKRTTFGSRVADATLAMGHTLDYMKRVVEYAEQNGSE